jgi:hypothetical protein
MVNHGNFYMISGPAAIFRMNGTGAPGHPGTGQAKLVSESQEQWSALLGDSLGEDCETITVKKEAHLGLAILSQRISQES